MNSQCILFCGNSSMRLGELICKNSSEIQLGDVEHTKFPSGEFYCQYKTNLRGADAYLLNAVTIPANDNLMQLLIMADAARRASAGRITAVVPYLGYSRQDRKDKSRVPISAKLVMNLFEAAGIQRVVTMDLHAPQIQGFTDLPVDHLYFRPALMNALNSVPPVNVIVSPDVGAIKRAEDYANRMDIDLAIVSKKRKNATTVETTQFIGNVDNKNVLIPDDLTESAGTLIEAATACRNRGARQVYCAVSHNCLTSLGVNRLRRALESNVINKFFFSNSVELPTEHTIDHPNMVPVDVSLLFYKAILSINKNESVSSLFS